MFVDFIHTRFEL